MNWKTYDQSRCREPVVLPLCLDQQYNDMTPSLLSDSLSHVTQGSAPMVMPWKPSLGRSDNENLEFSGYTLNYNINFKNFQEKLVASILTLLSNASF